MCQLSVGISVYGCVPNKGCSVGLTNKFSTGTAVLVSLAQSGESGVVENDGARGQCRFPGDWKRSAAVSTFFGEMLCPWGPLLLGVRRLSALRFWIGPCGPSELSAPKQTAAQRRCPAGSPLGTPAPDGLGAQLALWTSIPEQG